MSTLRDQLLALLGPSHPHDEGRECGTCAAYNLLLAQAPQPVAGLEDSPGLWEKFTGGERLAYGVGYRRGAAEPRWHHSPDAPPEHFCEDCDSMLRQHASMAAKIEELSAPQPVAGLDAAFRASVKQHVSLGHRLIFDEMRLAVVCPVDGSVVLGLDGALAQAPQPVAGLDAEWAAWIVEEDDRRHVTDHACAQCMEFMSDPPTGEGFVCVPHQARVRLAKSDGSAAE